MDRIVHHHLAQIYGQALDKLCEPKRQARQSRISLDGECLSFIPDGKREVGLYIAGDSLNSHQNYFEIEITDVDDKGDITLGLVSSCHPLDKFPGWYQDSLGYHSKNGKKESGNEIIFSPGHITELAPMLASHLQISKQLYPKQPETSLETSLRNEPMKGVTSQSTCNRLFRIYKGIPKESLLAPVCSSGDFMGCGIRFENSSLHMCARQRVVVFFTKNGKEMNMDKYKNDHNHMLELQNILSIFVYKMISNAISFSLGLPIVSMLIVNTAKVASTEFILPEEGLYPAVCFFLVAAEVRLMLGIRWSPEDDVLMCIDGSEEDWARLHDIKLNGMVLEYAGRGKSIIDVGLAQAKYPLDTTHHYFEIEIVDPGENCYIAIGLARKDYPKYRHPGWNKGSIAYHADDGKIFVGSGVGEPFGPPCHKGDKMGCGIIFPLDFISFSEDDMIHSSNFEEGSFSESDEEEWFQEKENTEAGTVVQVFFTRNQKTVGQKDACIPKGGFYPTVGMLSSNEKVKVDLHPLTG